MALDSRDKRAAALQCLQPWLFAPPLPDATLDSVDREQLGHLYRGIPLNIPSGLTSRERRASGIEFLQTGVFAPPLPDGTIGASDRGQLRTLYSRSVSVPGSGNTIWDDGATVWDVLWDVPSLINTRDRRASVVEFLQIPRRVLPLADATIGAPDRASLAALYRGITLQTGIASHLDTRNKRAGVLQYLQTGVFVPSLPDGALSAADRAQIDYLYPGIAAIFSLPIYTGSGALMRSGSAISQDTGSNVAYAGNSAAFIGSLCQMLGNGTYSIVFNPTGSGQALSDSVVSGAGAYNGSVNGVGDAVSSTSSMAGSGTFTLFTGLSSGSAFAQSTALLSGVGSYTVGVSEFVDALQEIALEIGPDRLVTLIEGIRAMAAVLCGTTSGTPTQAGTMGYHAIGNPTVARVSGEEDGRGTRDSVTLTLDP